MRCLSCGEEITGERLYCERCAPIAGGAPVSSGASDTLSKIVPYKNMPALIGYYLAVFSLIPCLGLVLAPFALVLGIKGLSQAKQSPEAHGKVLAWVAILLGGAMLLNGFCFISMLLENISRSTP